jgi:hypothetical protein
MAHASEAHAPSRSIRLYPKFICTVAFNYFNISSLLLKSDVNLTLMVIWVTFGHILFNYFLFVPDGPVRKNLMISWKCNDPERRACDSVTDATMPRQLTGS